MNLLEIISEADTLVPNAYQPADKVIWLNEVNNEFFDIVKIPMISKFDTVSNVSEYSLPSDVRTKNIDLVRVGLLQYRSMQNEDVLPAQNYWIFDDNMKKITLSPAPYRTDVMIVRYHRIATSTFVSSNLQVTPDAPPEYHWVYTLGLCARIAKAQDDINKANNYSAEYQNALNVASQNYAKVVGQ